MGVDSYLGAIGDLIQIIEGMNSVLFIIGAVLFLIIGTMVIRQSIKTKVKNLRYLGIFILFTGLFLIISSMNQLFTLDITTETIITVTSQVSIYISIASASSFLIETFYKEHEKIYYPIILIVIIGFITTLLMDIYLIGKQFDAPEALVFWITTNAITGGYVSIAGLWQAIASYVAFKKIKMLEIEPAVKQKYKLYSISGVLIILIGLNFMIPYSWLFSNALLSATLNIVGVINVLIYNIVSYLIWIMPDKIRNYFNKGYSPPHPDDAELSEEDIMKQLK